MKHAKVLRQAGFQVDDDLTPQQQERKSFGDDFTVLMRDRLIKAKGHDPLFRTSQLHFYVDKMQTCRKGKASAIPPADYRQAKDQGCIETVLETKQPPDDKQAKAKALLKLLLTNLTSGLS